MNGLFNNHSISSSFSLRACTFDRCIFPSGSEVIMQLFFAATAQPLAMEHLV